MIRKLSFVALSNIYTMFVASQKDPRQKIPHQIGIPVQSVAECRAMLLLEETLETIKALGVEVRHNGLKLDMRKCSFYPSYDHGPDLLEIIDGCCDINYVATGTMLACGVPDVPHLEEVCRANDDKFPNGLAITNEAGKYLKPEGWKGPDHKAVMASYNGFDLAAFAQYYVAIPRAQAQLRKLEV